MNGELPLSFEDFGQVIKYVVCDLMGGIRIWEREREEGYCVKHPAESKWKTFRRNAGWSS